MKPSLHHFNCKVDMSRALLHFALLALHSWAYQQLLDAPYTHYFQSTDLPLVISPSSDEICSAVHTRSYSITSWMYFYSVPTGSKEFYQLWITAGVIPLRALYNSDGSVTAQFETCLGTLATLELTGLLTHTWLHIGVSVASYSHVLISAITWAGVQVANTQDTSLSFPLFNAGTSRITLGGSGSVIDQTLMVDARFYTVGLTAAEMLADTGAGVCPVECFTLCFGPGLNSCYFYQFIDRNTPVVLNAGSNEVSIGYKRTDASYSATGWFYFTETDNIDWRCLFRLTETTTDIFTLGDRTMLISLGKVLTPHGLELAFDTTVGISQRVPHLSLPVRSKLGRISAELDIYSWFCEEWFRYLMLWTFI